MQVRRTKCQGFVFDVMVGDIRLRTDSEGRTRLRDVNVRQQVTHPVTACQLAFRYSHVR
jgi:hypothetical protein